MKSLEEIENLSLEELERKALEAPVTVPDGLERRLRQTDMKERCRRGYRIISDRAWIGTAFALTAAFTESGTSNLPG